MIKYLKPYPSIVSWVLFNEGWGQAETQAPIPKVVVFRWVCSILLVT